MKTNKELLTERVKRAKKLAGRPYDPKINRWTGKPHEHKREKARRARQA